MKSLVKASLTLVITLFSSSHLFAIERSSADLARDKSSKPQEIMEFLGVQSGDTILDFLGGGGYYSQLLKEKVGEKGKVVLHTNKAYLSFVGKALKKRTESGGLAGVEQLVSEAEELNLGKAKYDSALLVLGYHDFFFEEGGWSFPSDKVMPQLYDSLKPGGKLLIIDHSAADGSGTKVTQTLHRIEEAFVKQELSNRGFKFVKALNILKNPNDDRKLSVFDNKIRRKTDRFVHLYAKN